jgi:hypothetical protein
MSAFPAKDSKDFSLFRIYPQANQHLVSRATYYPRATGWATLCYVIIRTGIWLGETILFLALKSNSFHSLFSQLPSQRPGGKQQLSIIPLCYVVGKDRCTEKGHFVTALIQYLMCGKWNYPLGKKLYLSLLLTLILLTWRIWWAPNNASRWQMEFNSAFKGLI